MINDSPSWINLFQKNYIENYICLVIKAYQSISTESYKKIELEEVRRTELVDAMRRLKGEFHINFPITYESGEKRKRMDICCYLDGLGENLYICFECKRFVEKKIIKSFFESEYYGEGIKRYEDGVYSKNMPQAGMIAFLESGDMDKLNKLIKKELPIKAKDYKVDELSLQYNFNYVYKTLHARKDSKHDLFLYHILLNFT